MRASPSRFLAAVAQAILRVLVHGLQHPIPCRACLLVGRDQVLVDQRRELLHDIRSIDLVSRADLLRTPESPATGEDGRATLEAMGEVRRPSVSDLFVATMKGTYA